MRGEQRREQKGNALKLRKGRKKIGSWRGLRGKIFLL